jgi:hypothetical protein
MHTCGTAERFLSLDINDLLRRGALTQQAQ